MNWLSKQGSLGRRLLLHIEDLMHTGDEIPAVSRDAPLKDTLHEMTRKGLGMTAVLFTAARDADKAATSADTLCENTADLPAIIDRLAK